MGTRQEQHEDRLSPGTVIDGRYRVDRLIGQGGNGLVHEVVHVLTGRHLALKSLLDDSGAGRLEQEARAASVMKNPHAVKVTDMGQNELTGPYIVMELLEGQSLRSLLDETGQLPADLTVDIALQVCECLAEAHGHGIIHRDLKPENIHLCPTVGTSAYDVKVLDFGVVKIHGDGEIPASSLTRTGSTVGTPFYMSLEQLRNSSNVDARADVYALSVVLYESLTGTKPFQAETLGDLVYVLCSGPPTHLRRLRPDLPAPLCDAVMRGLSLQREQRQAAMLELAEDLLPFGDATLGAWMRPEARRPVPVRPVAINPGQKTEAFPTPSGLESVIAAPRSPIVPAAGRPAPIAAPVAPVAPIVASKEEAIDAPIALASKEPELPDLELARPPVAKVEAPVVEQAESEEGPEGGFEIDDDPFGRKRARDTPTEMFQPAVDFEVDRGEPHVTPAAGAPAEDPRESLARQAPTLPLPGRPTMRLQQDALETLRSERPTGLEGAAIEDPASMSSPSLTAPPKVALGPLPPVAPRPAWQQSIDAQLSGIGTSVERAAGSVAEAFRAAPPRQQLALVIVCAGVVGVFLVLLFYLSLAH